MAAQDRIEGIVLLAQESRFQLTDDSGVSHLFVLAHDAAAEAPDLAILQERQARVCVHAGDATNRKARAAHRIEICPSSAKTE